VVSPLYLAQDGALADLVRKSALWPQKITYPAENVAAESCTSSMIPVANLAREGYTPAAMGMVLCNDDDLTGYTAMVQGFHAEGVVSVVQFRAFFLVMQYPFGCTIAVASF
jgi:hypothetical protein